MEIAFAINHQDVAWIGQRLLHDALRKPGHSLGLMTIRADFIHPPPHPSIHPSIHSSNKKLFTHPSSTHPSVDPCIQPPVNNHKFRKFKIMPETPPWQPSISHPTVPEDLSLLPNVGPTNAPPFVVIVWVPQWAWMNPEWTHMWLMKKITITHMVKALQRQCQVDPTAVQIWEGARNVRWSLDLHAIDCHLTAAGRSKGKLPPLQTFKTRGRSMWQRVLWVCCPWDDHLSERPAGAVPNGWMPKQSDKKTWV